MFQFILVPATGAPTDDPVFRTALALARPAGGHLAFLHVRLDMQHTLLAVAGTDLTGVSYDGVVDSVQHDVESRERQAHAAVAAFCAQEHVALSAVRIGAGPSASWHVDAGDEAICLAAHGRTADLTVLGRPHGEAKVDLHRLEAVLLESGRPLLVGPATAPNSVGRRIAIAWKDAPAAGRAVAAILPLLAQAESVTVLAVQEATDTAGDTDSGRRLRDALRWHNPATTLQVLPGSHLHPVDALLTTVEGDGTDLLVMGGYSHSRMREAVFGGFTRTVLYEAGLPVLIVH